MLIFAENLSLIFNMSCVNTNSQEFISTSERLNVSKEDLELIVHEFINTPGHEDSFPSDAYIQGRLVGSNQQISKTGYELWQKKYSQPLVFPNKVEARWQYDQAVKCFGKEAVRLYTDASGNKVLTVAAPRNPITKQTSKANRQAFLDRLIQTQSRIAIDRLPKLARTIFKSAYETEPGPHYSIVIPNSGRYSTRKEAVAYIKQRIAQAGAQKSAFSIGDVVTHRDQRGQLVSEIYISFPSAERSTRAIKERTVAEQDSAIRQTPEEYYNSLSEDERLSQMALEEQEAREDRLYEEQTDDEIRFTAEDFIKEGREAKRTINREVGKLPLGLRERVRRKLNQLSPEKGIYYENVGSAYFSEDGTTTAREVLQKITKESTDSAIRELAQRVLDNIGIVGSTVLSRQEKGKRLSIRGTYFFESQDIEIYNSALSGTTEASAKNSLERTIIHEIVHAITSRGMKADPAIREKIASVYDELLGLTKKYSFLRAYALKNEREFVAEFLSKPVFREALMLIPSRDKNLTIGQKVINFIKELLGIKPKDTLFNKADTAIKDILDSTKNTIFFTNEFGEEFEDTTDNTRYVTPTRDYTTSPGFFEQTYGYKVVPNNELEGKLAGTNSATGEIRVRESITFDELIDYIAGAIEGPYSAQKKAVFNLLSDLGYTKEKLSELLETQEDIQRFLVYHEFSHLFNQDSNYYWEPGEIGGPKNWMTPKKIAIEAKATMDAINRLAREKGMEDLIGTPIKQEIKQQDSYMTKQKEVKTQLDALQNSAILAASEVQHIAEQAVFWISDHITELQTRPGLAAQIYGPAHEGVDYSTMSRADVVRKIGPDIIMKRCQLQFSPMDKDGRPRYRSRKVTKKAELITDNWQAVMMLASSTFLNTENFSITSTSDGKTSEVITELNEDVDNFNESNNQLDVEENEGSLQEHWQVETKTLDVLATMSQLVKQALMKCYQIDENGNKVTSEWGINERVDVREATNSILRWTQGALTLESMVAKLQEKQAGNPWVGQLIERLSDKTGKETDFQGQFFNTFCKHFQPYSVVIEENGVFKSIPVNQNPALSEAITQVTTQYKIGEHPLFTSEGVNKETFNQMKAAFDGLEKFSHQGGEVTSPKNREEASRLLGFISNALGYYVTSDMVAQNLTQATFEEMKLAAKRILKALKDNLDNKEYDPFTFKANGSIEGNVRKFLKPITDHLEDTAVSAFYDSGKMYQSYITPSYMSKLMQKFSQQGQDFADFIKEEYGDYTWFRTVINGRPVWRNLWLEMLDRNLPIGGKSAREIFKHKVQLNFNKHNYMRNMSDIEYTLSVLTEYFSEVTGQNQGTVPAWFRVPMMSNKPSSEFIRFASFRDAFYKDTITDGLKRIFDQEMSRIQTVLMRNLGKKDAAFIKNFDTNGRKFNFLDFMNTYLEGGEQANSELGKLIQKKLKKTLSTEEEARLNELALEAIYNEMDARATRIVYQWETAGLFEGAKKINNIGKTDDEIRENLTNFVWNDTFAAMNIMQLTITDMAFYKDAEDLQKRLAQIHAPGVRGNVNATDYNGKPITDGRERTFYLRDFDSFVSNIIENVSIVFNRRIEAAPESEKAALRALRESLVGEDGAFRKINVADAQGYSCPTSYRKKALIFGRWSRQAEEIWEKLRSGNYTYNDLSIAFQPLKPFVYSQIAKSAGVEGAPMSKMKVPVQNKNSEYLLIMADALLQGEDTGRPNLLRAIYQVMEESATKTDENGNKVYRNDGIDTVQFESTVKSGLTGIISLNDFLEAEDGEALAKQAMLDAIYKDGQYNETFVHEIPFEDYCLQQEVPEHFKNHEQAHGSQGRYIIVSELETTDYLGKPVTYKCEGRDLTADKFKSEYERTISDNISDSIASLSTELGLDKYDLKERNIALSKILQREILSSPRYGFDLLQACSVDENGQFRIPLGDPIQSKRIEQLINSVIKNRVNKQEIAGGPVVQVTNFGTSKQLNIRFKDKKGGLLMTRKEFEAKPRTQSYEDYIKYNQGGIAYFEVFAPIYSDSIFENFQNADGSIDMEAIEATNPDLLKMIGYRIPTEDKYSMAPLKIVGFLPREAGDGIMLPNDITLLTGSDFDVDKEYLMRKEITVRPKKRKEISDALYDIAVKQAEKRGSVSLEQKQAISEEIRNFLDIVDTRDFRTSYEEFLWKHYKRVAYEAITPTEGRAYRNNKIVDMTYEVLTHETAADKVLNPGSFEPQKRMGYAVSAFKDPNNEYTWDELMNMSVLELKELSSKGKNLAYIDTHIQFYKQNSAAGALIGIFAVNRIAHAVLESDGYRLNVDDICNITEPFTIAGMEFGGSMPFDMKYDRKGQLIGKVMGSLVASAADAVKDPILNLMNINSNTANILNTLIRMGMPFDDAALFLSQGIITDVLVQHSSENITGYTSLNKIIKGRIQEMENNMNIDENSPLRTEELTYDELVDGLKGERKAEIEYKTLRAFSQIQKLAEALRMPTFATRFNSISSAVGPLIIDNLTIEHKMRQLNDNSKVVDADGNPVTMDDIFRKHPILAQFSRTVGLAKQLFGTNMPANSTGFRKLVEFVESSSLGNSIFGDKKLLSAFSDFYQSYLVMKGEVVEGEELGRFITEFPKEFLDGNYKEKYPDNAFVQAIKIGTDKSGRATLQINTTGLDTQQKERLSTGWIDLHKVNPQLSIDLFKYNFFRTGIGFSPKTFMSLVPVYIKERIPGYVESFRRLPEVVPEIVVDQFVRNNWDNNRLVPRKTGRNVTLRDEGNKTVVVYKETQVQDMKNIPYFKIKRDNRDVLYQRIAADETSITYQEVSPLGNNKEYVEMSVEDIIEALNAPTEAIATTEQTSEIAESSNSQVDAETEQSENLLSNTEAAKRIYQALEAARGSRESANELLRKWKDSSATSVGQRMEFIETQLQRMNLEFDREALKKELEKYC